MNRCMIFSLTILAHLVFFAGCSQQSEETRQEAVTIPGLNYDQKLLAHGVAESGHPPDKIGSTLRGNDLVYQRFGGLPQPEGGLPEINLILVYSPGNQALEIIGENCRLSPLQNRHLGYMFSLPIRTDLKFRDARQFLTRLEIIRIDSHSHASISASGNQRPVLATPPHFDMLVPGDIIEWYEEASHPASVDRVLDREGNRILVQSIDEYYGDPRWITWPEVAEAAEDAVVLPRGANTLWENPPISEDAP
ncbi:MAG: hypothetical protein Q8Q20_01655 [bacterium]|nr:hypothetical protein [bacterium]